MASSLPPQTDDSASGATPLPPLSPPQRYTVVRSSENFSSSSRAVSAASRSEKLQAKIEAINEDPDNVKLWCDLGMKLLEKDNGYVLKKVDYFAASMVLQLAADAPTSYLTRSAPDGKDGKFWVQLATAHFHVWLKDGILAQKHRLEKAKRACEKAFEFQDNLANQYVWEMLVSILLYSGELSIAQKR